MKRAILVFPLLFLAHFTNLAQMKLVFNTGLSDGTTISLPLSGNVNVTVDWGDGFIESYTNIANISHTYALDDIYSIEISGSAEQFGIGDRYSYVGCEKLVDVTSFGDLGLTSLSGAFKRARNLATVPDNIPPTVKDVSYMFSNATSFNHDIGGWDMSNVINMMSMFGFANIFNQDIGEWNVANVTNMDHVFYYADSFNNDIGSWDVGNVTSMNYMFGNAHSFDQEIGSWNVGNVTSMNGMFWGATYFNKDIGDWAVENVTDMSGMFSSAYYFDQNIGGWNVSNVTNMESMFSYANIFNQDIGMWDVGKVTNLNGMFFSAESFNQDISKWNVSNVTDMTNMFAFAYSFNQNIGGWDVSNVTDMTQLFAYASVFDQDIGMWNVEKVTQMYNMFTYAQSFNQNIGSWNVGNVIEMTSMFSNAYSFDQDLGSWDVSNVMSMDNMFYDTGLSTANYNSLLTGWATRDLKPGVFFDAGNSIFSPGAAANAREYIINTFGWTIIDGGIEPNNNVNQISSSLLQVYPNPFTSQIQVESSVNISRIVLLNIAGATEVIAQTKEEIRVEQLNAGIYFLRIEFVNHPPQLVKVIKN